MSAAAKASATLDAIIPAAGSGSRLGTALPKQYLPLGGRSMLLRSIEALQSIRELGRIIVALPPEDEERLHSPTAPEHLKALHEAASADVRLVFCKGAATRMQTVQQALELCHSSYVLVHDAARPLVSRGELHHLVFWAQQQRYSCVLPALPLCDSIKFAVQDLVEHSVDRSNLYRALTPQLCRTEELKAALKAVALQGESCTDEAEAMQRAGHSVALIPGSRLNFKITYPEDFRLAAAILKSRLGEYLEGQPQGSGDEVRQDSGAAPHALAGLRVGHGFDVHRFGGEGPVILGGERLEHPQGLIAHSDGDVLAHALCDALLGAACLGDIGTLFPDSDPKYAGADSLKLLSEVAALVRAKGYAIINVDATVIAQAPKIAPHAQAMRRNLAAALTLDLSCVGLKATTTEKLGFTGRAEGIAVEAVALLCRVAV